MKKFFFKFKDKDWRILYFILIMLIGIIIFWMEACFTNWQSTRTVFFCWTHHSLMDWFAELRRFGDGIYEGETPANYPALCFVIYRAFYCFLDWDIVYDGYDLRNLQQAMVPFIMLNTVLVIGFLKVFSKEFQCFSKFDRYLLTFVICMTGPSLFLFERGNLFMIALLLTFIYLMIYDSQCKKYRIISYFCLAIASAIKIYPAIFGVFSLKKRKFDKEVCFLIFLGIIIFFVPFAFFGGINGFKGFIYGLAGTSKTYSQEGFGYEFSIYNLCRLITSLLQGHQEEVVYIAPLFVTFIIGILGFICATEFWQQLCMCSLLIVFIPKFSWQYTLCFLLIPLVYLFKSPLRKIHGLYLAFFTLIFFPWVYIGIDKINYMLGFEFSHLFSVGHIFMYIGLLGMFFAITIEGCMTKLRLKSKGWNAK